MESLADRVLPMIRTRADLTRWSAANRHGEQMHEAVDELEAAFDTEDPAAIYDVITRAIASACTVLAKADDSSGIIGGATRRLLELHPRSALVAHIPPRKLVGWMIRFQFHNAADYFTIDVCMYAPALGAKGLALYRHELDSIRQSLGERPKPREEWKSQHSYEWFVLGYNERRLAVLDRDSAAIIKTHLRDVNIVAMYLDTARALDEAGFPTLAIHWAHEGMCLFFDDASGRCAVYWCELLERYHPEQEFEARLTTFRWWSTSSNASALYKVAGSRWSEFEPEVMQTLSTDSRQAVIFALTGLNDLSRAWALANDLGLSDERLWIDLVKRYEKVDPLATLPAQRKLVTQAISRTDAEGYRKAASRLAKMQRIAAGTDEAPGVDAFIVDLREKYRLRSRMQQEFDRVGLTRARK